MAKSCAEIVWCSMTFITKIKETNCHIEFIHLSGSIRTCKMFCMEELIMNEKSRAALLESIGTTTSS